MEDLRERIAYLQGLTEGLKFEEGGEETRIIKQIIDILGDLVDEVEELRAAQEDLEDYLESLDEDLYGDDDDDDWELEEDEDEGKGALDERESDEEFTEDDEEFEFVEVECPRCHDIICFDADIVDEEDIIEVTCPNCNEVVYVNDGSMPPPQRSGKAARQIRPSADQDDL